MLLSGHGKPGGSTERFRGVRTAAFAGRGTAARRSSSGGSGAAGGSAPAVGQSLGGAAQGRRTAGPEKSGTRGTARAFASGRLATDRKGPETGSGGAGLRNRSLDFVAGGAPDRAGMRGEISSRAGVADSAPVGVELPASGGTSAGTR